MWCPGTGAGVGSSAGHEGTDLCGTGGPWGVGAAGAARRRGVDGGGGVVTGGHGGGVESERADSSGVVVPWPQVRALWRSGASAFHRLAESPP